MKGNKSWMKVKDGDVTPTSDLLFEECESVAQVFERIWFYMDSIGFAVLRI